MVAAPVLAQEAPPQETTPPAEAQPAPPADRAAEPAPPAQDSTTVDRAQQAPAQPAQTQQPANAAQVAQVVDQGFPTYDRDADGSLTTDEFNSWMVALRSAGEPAFTGQSAADKEWLGRALAAADADKSGGVSKDELKTFLAPAVAS